MLELSPTSYLALCVLAAAGIWWWRRQSLPPAAAADACPAAPASSPAPPPPAGDARLAELARRVMRVEAALETLLTRDTPLPPARPDQPPVRETVYRLHDHGLDPRRIAEQAQISRGEVELLLALRVTPPA